MHTILETIYNLLPSDKKQRNNGWIYFNCPSCYHTENPDTKHRGNILFTDDGFVYQCFNCKFKCGFSLGQYLSKDTTQWLKDLGTSTKDLNDLRLLIREYNEANNDNLTSNEHKIIIKKREIKQIPVGYKSILKSLNEGENSYTFNEVIKYINNRNPYLLEWTDLLWCPKQFNFLIPCYEYDEIVGYSLRKLRDDVDSKYKEAWINSYYLGDIIDSDYHDEDYEPDDFDVYSKDIDICEYRGEFDGTFAFHTKEDAEKYIEEFGEYL